MQFWLNYEQVRRRERRAERIFGCILCNNLRMFPVLAVLLAALLFGTTGTAQALADVDGSPMSIGAVRILLGGGILACVALVTGSGRFAPRFSPGAPRPTPTDALARVPIWVIVLAGAIGVVAYQPTFFAGTRMNGVAVGTVIALGFAPIATGVLDVFVRRRIPTKRWMLATAIALIGVVLVSGLIGSASAAGVGPAGLLASLAAGASYAVYALSSKLLLDRGWSPSGAMGAVFGGAAVLSIPLLFTGPLAWLFTPTGITLALWLGIVTVAIAYLLFGWGLKRLSPTVVTTLTLGEPLSATLLGILVLHEQLTPIAMAGLAVIAVGLIVLSIPTRRVPTRKEPVDAPA
mgnify:CR=1 FL=1